VLVRGTTRVEDAQGTPTQSHISPSIPVYEEKTGGESPRRTKYLAWGSALKAWEFECRVQEMASYNAHADSVEGATRSEGVGLPRQNLLLLLYHSQA